MKPDRSSLQGWAPTPLLVSAPELPPMPAPVREQVPVRAWEWALLTMPERRCASLPVRLPAAQVVNGRQGRDAAQPPLEARGPRSGQLGHRSLLRRPAWAAMKPPPPSCALRSSSSTQVRSARHLVLWGTIRHQILPLVGRAQRQHRHHQRCRILAYTGRVGTSQRSQQVWDRWRHCNPLPHRPPPPKDRG